MGRSAVCPRSGHTHCYRVVSGSNAYAKFPSERCARLLAVGPFGRSDLLLWFSAVTGDDAWSAQRDQKQNGGHGVADGNPDRQHGVWRTKSTLIPAETILALDYSTVDSILDSAASSVEEDARKAGKAVSDFSSRAGGSRLFAAIRKWVPSKGIIVKSRLDLFVFGGGLPGEELRYLQSIIARALADF